MAESKELEVLKKALLLERQGRAFYQRVSKDSASEAVSNLFAIMADEEQKHIEYLSEQFAHFSAKGEFLQKEPGGADKTSVREILSSEIRNQISAASYEAAAISAAMEMENRAVAVYGERAESSDDPRERKLYAWLAQWETGHLKFLAEINDQLLEEVWYESGFWPF
jgi:rubrerythrin